jgi:hypothetical protein
MQCHNDALRVLLNKKKYQDAELTFLSKLSSGDLETNSLLGELLEGFYGTSPRAIELMMTLIDHEIANKRYKKIPDFTVFMKEHLKEADWLHYMNISANEIPGKIGGGEHLDLMSHYYEKGDFKNTLYHAYESQNKNEGIASIALSKFYRENKIVELDVEKSFNFQIKAFDIGVEDLIYLLDDDDILFHSEFGDKDNTKINMDLFSWYVKHSPNDIVKTKFWDLTKKYM